MVCCECCCFLNPNACIQTDCESYYADLCRCRLEGAPCVETTGETVRLVALAHQAQLSRVLCILGPHVLNVDLFEG